MTNENVPKGKSREISFSIVLDPSDDTHSIYANYAEVSHGQYEIGISFAHLPTKIGSSHIAAVEDGKLKWNPSLHVSLPPAIVRGLIRALEVQLDMYEKRFGTKSTDNVEQGNE